jgi:hypothetical protein
VAAVNVGDFVPLEPITSIFFDLDGTLCDPREAE